MRVPPAAATEQCEASSLASRCTLIVIYFNRYMYPLSSLQGLALYAYDSFRQG